MNIFAGKKNLSTSLEINLGSGIDLSDLLFFFFKFLPNKSFIQVAIIYFFTFPISFDYNLHIYSNHISFDFFFVSKKKMNKFSYLDIYSALKLI